LRSLFLYLSVFQARIFHEKSARRAETAALACARAALRGSPPYPLFVHCHEIGGKLFFFWWAANPVLSRPVVAIFFKQFLFRCQPILTLVAWLLPPL